jgi:hypothetical protein
MEKTFTAASRKRPIGWLMNGAQSSQASECFVGLK